MKFSRASIEILIDLVEIKISSLVVQDKEDNKELDRLLKCRDELKNLLSAFQPRDYSISNTM